MKSYAAVDRVEGNFVVCELEMISFEESKPEDCTTKETLMVDIPIDEFSFLVENGTGESIQSIESILEGSVFVFEHEDGENISVYSKDDAEKNRRIEYLRQLFKNNILEGE